MTPGTAAARWIHPNLELTAPSPGVQLLRIAREQKRNALSRGIMQALLDHLAGLRSDDAVRVLVLSGGTGKVFVAGADIGEYHGASQESFDSFQRLGRAVFSAVERLPQFTVAAVNGHALGGGFEIALCCDALLAAEGAKFGLPEITLGLLPGGGGTQRLARALGTRFTAQLVATGRPVPAAELHRRGLVTEVAPAGELLDRALELAAVVAANAPLAVRAAKRLVADGVAMALDDALTREQAVLSELYRTADAREGIAAFVEKRPAVFTGR
ncbi:enoyl-CoA hydratase-related protein [Actinomycetes bacterium KLBMP 9759]